MNARLAYLAAAALVVAIPLTASAQSSFSRGDRVLSLSFMTGGDYDGTGLGGQVELGVLPIGKATLGIGGFVGFQRDSEGTGIYKVTSNVVPIMAVGNLHIPIESQPNLDIYAGASVGFVHASVKANGVGTIMGKASNTDSGVGIQGGARYWLGSKLGLNAQIGFGDIPLIEAGVSFKF